MSSDLNIHLSENDVIYFGRRCCAHSNDTDCRSPNYFVFEILGGANQPPDIRASPKPITAFKTCMLGGSNEAQLPGGLISALLISQDQAIR